MAEDEITAKDYAADLGLDIQVARRYLESLVGSGKATSRIIPGVKGKPKAYRLIE